MVEVFKTNVTEQFHAKLLVDLLQRNFKDYAVSFDLEDCDKILRIESKIIEINNFDIIELLESLGFKARVLPDELPVSLYNDYNILTTV